jgi:hypothetical protein
MGDFGTYKDIVFQNNRSRTIGLTLGTTLPHRGAAKEAEHREARLELNFAYRAQRREVILATSAMYDSLGRKILATAYSKESEKHTASVMLPKSDSAVTAFLERRIRLVHFLVPMWQLVSDHLRRESSQEGNLELRRTAAFGENAFETLFSSLQNIEYLGPFRAVPKRTCLFSGERPARLGMDGEKAVNILASDYLRKGRLKKRLASQIIQWFKSANIARDLKIRALGDRHFEMLIQHAVTQEYENLADVGYGISQVLPVLAGGYNMSPNSTFIVEEPEIHLHPRAQANLADFFSNLYQRGIQCILETRSEHLIVRLQKHVATGRIDPKHLVVYYVATQGESKSVVKLTVGKNGLFQDKWPQGFFVEALTGTYGIVIDDGGKIKHEWLNTCQGPYFREWFVTQLYLENIKEVKPKLSEEHRKALLKLGFPLDTYDKIYISVANVTITRYIVSSDLDFFDPTLEQATEGAKCHVRDERKGLVCRFLLRKMRIRVGTPVHALAELRN